MLFAQAPEAHDVLLRQGRLELSKDTAGTLLLSLRDLSTEVRHRVALLLSPVVARRGGGLIPTRMKSAATIDTMPSGAGKLLLVSATSDGPPGDRIAATWAMSVPAGEGGPITVSVRLRNTGTRPLEVDSVIGVVLITDGRWFGADSAHSFWSFQGGTYPDRPDWAFPLTRNYRRENFLGMNAPDYGGGMPIVDLWTRRGGIALASLAGQPEPLALPVSVRENGQVEVRLVERGGVTIPPGKDWALNPFVLLLHHGDFFDPLRSYYRLMEAHPRMLTVAPAQAYGAEWCAWGYERGFRPDQILRTLPLVKSVGLDWVTIDDGYQDADGDWLPERAKFPRGGGDMRRLVDSIHALGLRARLWWVPLEAHDSAYSAAHIPGRMNEFGNALQSRVAREHPDWFQLNADGSRTQVSWWNSYTLCPAVAEVRRYYADVVTRFLRDWGFDGFKIDGQNMNAVPPCYNPAHHHASPFDAPRAVPMFFRAIDSAAATVRPDAVFTVCACGTNFSLYNLPYVTIPVAADPLSAWQVRHRAKAYKALLGGSAPYSGDHVELTNRSWDERTQRSVIHGEEDFASTVGVGGIIATKFTAPGAAQSDSSLMLDLSKEQRWRRWISIYRQERLSSAEYRNLYDIGFDRPEGHAIARGDTMYYAFYADSAYSGNVELRGLGQQQYRITDYEHGTALGEATGPTASIAVRFSHALLLKAIPFNRQRQ